MLSSINGGGCRDLQQASEGDAQRVSLLGALAASNVCLKLIGFYPSCIAWVPCLWGRQHSERNEEQLPIEADVHPDPEDEAPPGGIFFPPGGAQSREPRCLGITSWVHGNTVKYLECWVFFRVGSIVLVPCCWDQLFGVLARAVKFVDLISDPHDLVLWPASILNLLGALCASQFVLLCIVVTSLILIQLFVVGWGNWNPSWTGYRFENGLDQKPSSMWNTSQAWGRGSNGHWTACL